LNQIRGNGSNPEIDFEKGVSILFNLCGFRASHVGNKYETAAQQERKNIYGKPTVSIDV